MLFFREQDRLDPVLSILIFVRSSWPFETFRRLIIRYFPFLKVSIFMMEKIDETRRKVNPRLFSRLQPVRGSGRGELRCTSRRCCKFR